jgi:hypothetical protein
VKMASSRNHTASTPSMRPPERPRVTASFPQAELIVNLRQHYKRWTGRAFRMRAACQKYDVPQCNRRRDIIDGGRNHYHFLASDSAPKMNLNLTWSRRWRRGDAASLRRRRCGRMGVYAPRERVAVVSRRRRSHRRETTCRDGPLSSTRRRTGASRRRGEVLVGWAFL